MHYEEEEKRERPVKEDEKEARKENKKREKDDGGREDTKEREQQQRERGKGERRSAEERRERESRPSPSGDLARRSDSVQVISMRRNNVSVRPACSIRPHHFQFIHKALFAAICKGLTRLQCII